MNYDDAGTAPEVERVDVGGGMAPEELPSLSDFATEPGGAWPKGWYGAEVVEAYATGKGTIFTTEDKPSKAGDSRNLVLCFSMDGSKLGTRNTFVQVNYRETDFTADRMAAVKEAREQFKGMRGAWTGNTDLQRSSLALAQLGQIENALGFRIKLHPSGHILAASLVGQKMDVRLGEDEKGYNEINAFAKAGTRAKK
jgi:hypothetical protein